MDRIKIINFSKYEDSRGLLVPFESYKNIPFNIERIFFIKDLNDIPRGFHVHRKSLEIVVPISGSFDVDLTDGYTNSTYHMNSCTQGLLIPNRVWLKMYNFSSNCVILAICSHKYDTSEYTRDYDLFLQEQEEIEKQTDIIPFFSLSEQTLKLKSEIMESVSSILDSGEFVLGSELRKFEQNFAEYNDIKYCVGLSNGTSALISAIKSLKLDDNINNNDTIVAIQSNTYIAGPLAIECCNLEIKIIDVDPNLNMDLDKLERSIKDNNIKVVIVVHMYGSCPNMNRLIELKDKYGFYLIEDCAQAHGSEFNGKKLGTFGDIGCFSFYPSKNLGSYGEGGCIITNNVEYYDYIRKYRNYGSVEKYQWEIKGVNDRLHNIQASILNIKLKYLNQWNANKLKLAEIYNTRLNIIKSVTIPQNVPELHRAYHLYVILVEDRDNLIKYLNDNNIYCGIHYPITFYKSSAFKELNDQTYDADIYSNKILSLPMYPELSEEDVNIVCNKIISYYI